MPMDTVTTPSTTHLEINKHSVKDFTTKYAEFVNPQWVNLLSTLGISERFVRSAGTELFTDTGEIFLDFLSGYGVYNVGHHHPYITEQLSAELLGQRPTMLQSHVPELAAQLGERLCLKAGGRIEKVFFTSSGSEGVESAIKFARAFTRRPAILYAEGGFHGLTYGALSIMSNPWWREGFGPVLGHTHSVPFGNLAALSKELSTGRYAAYILEPIQGESGINCPPPDYLKDAQRLCDKFGTLLVIDEVQTGLHRTGPFLASKHYGIEPDMIILAKALSGGQVPVGALLMRTDICRSVFSSIDKAFVHASTFGENALAMRAGLATLDVLEREHLAERAETMGNLLRRELRRRLTSFEMVKEIRGLGLFNAIEFQPPQSLGLKILHAGFSRAHPGLFGQMIVKLLFQEVRILSQMAGNNYMVIKSLPPLTVSEAQILKYAAGLERVCELMHNDKTKFWSQGIIIASKAFKHMN